MAFMIPEQGQLIQVRKRFWQVQDVIPYTTTDSSATLHHLRLECLDDDYLGESLNVIWEREIDPKIFEAQELPDLNGWDSPARFEAFLTAIRWSSVSLLERDTIQAPFHAAIDIEEYQLEPVVRALTMPRANLLIADDVGLGKTIEAGLVIQEMLARRRIRRILIVCPASLQRQWQEEMRDKFQLSFEIIDRDTVQQLRREYGIHVNPWTSSSRLITSMDFLKREQPLRLFEESLQSQKSLLRDWDLLIVDEAHNVAPSGRQHYAVDSDRTKMLRRIADHFEHRLFLTATPHNGFTESFTALLELLDPIRFSRGPDINREQVEQVMVRRLKEEIKGKLGQRKFAERVVQPLEVDLPASERQVNELLESYTDSRLKRLAQADSMPVRFALTMLKKRLLSSPRAFKSSLATHFKTLGAAYEEAPDLKLVERMAQRVDEDWANDEEKKLREEDALIESSRFFSELTSQERHWLQTMDTQASHPNQSDAKANALLNWIENHLRDGKGWNRERLIIFTEYKDTLDYLKDILAELYGEERLLSLVGGMNLSDREAIKTAFQTNPDENPIRILIATDAASEGLNLQAYCRYLIHYEIPWNPNRMEQRNGRIDRHGQKAEEVNIFHFLYADHEDSHFLKTVVEKVQTMREDLGSVGDVIAAQVEEAMLGVRRELNIPTKRRQIAQSVVKGELLTENRIREIVRHINRTRDDLSLYPETMQRVLDEALKLIGHNGLTSASDPQLEGKAFRLLQLPTHWRDTTLTDNKGRAFHITFDYKVAQNRRDTRVLHLNHPLMKQALGVFRARLWTENTGSNTLNRVSYRILPDSHLTTPVVLAFGRLIAIGQTQQRLHEEILTVGGEINEAQLFPLSREDVQRLLQMSSTQLPISQNVGNKLRRLYYSHKRDLIKLLDEAEQKAVPELTARAADLAQTDAKTIAELINQRIKEIEQRLKQEQKDSRPPDQLELFDRDEFLQYQEDIEWLKRKQEQLKERRDSEPKRVQEVYQLKSVRVFPLAVLYLLPESLRG